MRRGDLYRIRRPGGGDPRKSRVFVVVSRQTLIDSRFSTVICAPVYSRAEGLATEVAVGVEEGLRHPSSILCDALVSLPKSRLTDFVGSLSVDRTRALDDALRVALEVEDAGGSGLDDVPNGAPGADDPIADLPRSRGPRPEHPGAPAVPGRRRATPERT